MKYYLMTIFILFTSFITAGKIEMFIWNVAFITLMHSAWEFK